MLINEKKIDNVKRTLNSSKRRERSFNVTSPAKARRMVEKFKAIGCDDADGCYNYFVKCFSRLSEDTVWSIYENAVNNPDIKSPIKYFIAACRNQMH